MNDNLGYLILPENADIILFAQDFVNHLLLEHDLPLLSSGIADYRHRIYNAFTTEVRLAANYLYRRLEELASGGGGFLKKVMDSTDIVKDFPEHVNDLSIETVRIRHTVSFRARKLMRFCVKISTMAAKYYARGFLDAPFLAFEHIINIINDADVIHEAGWDALYIEAARYSRRLMDVDNLTPDNESDDPPSPETESDAYLTPITIDSSSKENSDASHSPDKKMESGDQLDETDQSDRDEADQADQDKTYASRSPDHEMVSGYHQDENHQSDQDNADRYETERVTGINFCQNCIAAMGTSSDGLVLSSSICEHVEKTIDVISENIASDNTSDSNSSASSKGKMSEISHHSFEDTSSEDDAAKQKVRKRHKKKPAHSYSKVSDSGSDMGETDLEMADN